MDHLLLNSLCPPFCFIALFVGLGCSKEDKCCLFRYLKYPSNITGIRNFLYCQARSEIVLEHWCEEPTFDSDTSQCGAVPCQITAGFLGGCVVDFCFLSFCFVLLYFWALFLCVTQFFMFIFFFPFSLVLLLNAHILRSGIAVE